MGCCTERVSSQGMASARDQVNLGNKAESAKIEAKTEQSCSETLNTQSDMKTDRSIGEAHAGQNEEKLREPEQEPQRAKAESERRSEDGEAFEQQEEGQEDNQPVSQQQDSEGEQEQQQEAVEQQAELIDQQQQNINQEELEVEETKEQEPQNEEQDDKKSSSSSNSKKSEEQAEPMNKLAGLIGEKLVKQVKDQQMHDLLEANETLKEEITNMVQNVGLPTILSALKELIIKHQYKLNKKKKAVATVIPKKEFIALCKNWAD